MILHDSKSDAKDCSPTDSGQTVRIRIDGETIRRPITDFDDIAKVTEIQAQLAEASEVRVWLRRAASWPPEERFALLSVLAASTVPIRYMTRKGVPDAENLFDAVLAMMVGTADMDRYGRAKQMTLEAAAICYPTALEAAVDRIAGRLKELGVTGVNRRDLIRDVRRIRDAAMVEEPPEPGTGRRVCDVVRDFPFASDLVIPPGWSVTPDSIQHARRTEQMMPVLAVVVITARHIDAHRHSESVSLAWHRDGAWREMIVDRAVIANVRTIVDVLAAHGVPVTSNNARTLVQFLAEFEAVNSERIPRRCVSSQLGWQGASGEGGFLLGRELIGAPQSGDAVVFRGRDEGDDQLGRGFGNAQGTLDGWLEIIDDISPYDRAKLILYASFAAPLLAIVEAPNIIVDLAGPTTCGKTAAARIAASIWGSPKDSDPDAILKTWDGTPTWMERVLETCCGLPVIVDDTKVARNPAELARTIYGVSQGRSRGRGTIDGLAKMQSTQTVMITTGEQPIVSFGQDGGARARVLALWGSPFGKASPKTGKRVGDIVRRLQTCYGHAGRRYVEYLAANRAQWPRWRRWYGMFVRKFGTLAGENRFAGRMAPHLAVIRLAAKLAHRALDMPWKYADPVTPLWAELTRDSADANRGLAALRYVMDWASSHQEEFFGRATSNRIPSQGWAGRWDAPPTLMDEAGNPTQGWPWIGFIRSRLEAILAEGKFEIDAILRMWHDDGFLVATTEQGKSRRQIKARVGRENVWLIAIRREAFDAANAG